MDGQSSWSYKLKSSVNEHQTSPTYCVTFNSVEPAHYKLLATSTGRRITVYACLPDGGLDVVQGYQDANEEEEFFVVKWSRKADTGAALLLAAGLLGQIRILNCHDQSLLWTAGGHGGAINDIAVHPSNPHLFVTASKDCSMRLWNLETHACVLIISGDGGHTNEVLSLDFHPFNPLKLLSGAMDDTIKIWSLEDYAPIINASNSYNPESGISFKTAHVSHPLFSSSKVHGNYVDCVRWMGDIIVSKSVDNKVLMWQETDESESLSKSRTKLTKTGVHLLQELFLEDADVWYIRFSMDLYCQVLACGSRFGRLFLWDLTAKSSAARRPKTILRVPVKDKSTIRQTAVSHDGAIVVACCDDGTIHRFDRVPKIQNSPDSSVE